MEKLLRLCFWLTIWSLALYGLHELSQRYTSAVLLGIVLLIGGIAVSEKRSREKASALWDRWRANEDEQALKKWHETHQ